MLKYVLIVVAVAVAATFNPAVATPGGDAGAEVPYATSGKESLDKTGTTRGQEKEAGSQVLVESSLTSPVSLHAEGTGLDRPCIGNLLQGNRLCRKPKLCNDLHAWG